MKLRWFRRRETLDLSGYTGVAYCGCRFLNGAWYVPCQQHKELLK